MSCACTADTPVASTSAPIAPPHAVAGNLHRRAARRAGAPITAACRRGGSPTSDRLGRSARSRAGWRSLPVSRPRAGRSSLGRNSWTVPLGLQLGLRYCQWTKACERQHVNEERESTNSCVHISSYRSENDRQEALEQFFQRKDRQQ